MSETSRAPQRGRSYCSVNGCFNSSELKPNISYFKHPKDVNRRKLWLELIGREELASKPAKHYCVCEVHFDVQDILIGSQRKLLKKDALPCHRLPAQASSSIEPTREIESAFIKVEEDSDDPLSSIADPPEASRKRKLPSPTPECSKNATNVQNGNIVFLGPETFQTLCNRFLSKELSNILKADTALKQFTGKKALNLKIMSLNLYHSNPQAYRLLQSALRLPLPTTLHSDLLPITTEINNHFISLLASKVNSMTDKERNCSAVIASIPLKPNLFYNIKHDLIIGFHEINGVRLSEIAEQAYVIILRGIYSNWNQPVGYALLSRGDNSVEVIEWIDSLLEELIKIGFNVRTFVSDTGDEFIDAAKKRSVSIDKPYFYINDKKIFYIFDVPHLIKLVRNFFIEHDFFFHGREAKYEHVRTFYDNDKTKEFKLAPKLTKNHIHPTNFEKTELRYATQIFSNSVATGISTYVDFHVIDKCARNTADFIKLMNNLFDSLNSSDSYTNDYKCVFRGVKSQKDFFNEMLLFFRDLKLSDGTLKMKFIEGFQTTITSVLHLFNELKAEGYTFLPTRSLNMEVIDQLTHKIRIGSGIASKPTSRQFVSTYRKFLLQNCVKPKERKNSAEDLTKWLLQIQSNKFILLQNKEVTVSEAYEKVQKQYVISTSDYNQQEFDKNHSLIEVSHFLLSKCREKHECKLFKLYAKPHLHTPDYIEESRYRSYKEYFELKGKILTVVPCDNFIRFVKKMDAIFVPCFKTANCKKNIGELLFNSIIDEPYNSPPCPCFPKAYLVKLFTRMKMYDVIKSNNNGFGSSRATVWKFIVNRY